jgi:hypothetical protein
VLQTLVPSFLQLVAMAARMITLSPVLSFATISVSTLNPQNTFFLDFHTTLNSFHCYFTTTVHFV